MNCTILLLLLLCSQGNQGGNCAVPWNLSGGNRGCLGNDNGGFNDSCGCNGTLGGNNSCGNDNSCGCNDSLGNGNSCNRNNAYGADGSGDCGCDNVGPSRSRDYPTF